MLQCFKRAISWRIFSIPPAARALPDQFMVSIGSIRKKHICKDALIFVFAMGLEETSLLNGSHDWQ